MTFCSQELPNRTQQYLGSSGRCGLSTARSVRMSVHTLRFVPLSSGSSGSSSLREKALTTFPGLVVEREVGVAICDFRLTVYREYLKATKRSADFNTSSDALLIVNIYTSLQNNARTPSLGNRSS